ncbi:uncharacterized protein (TIGR01777 family) [Evansella vedderi]|uniref:Uncharacterized protein (TIGR01777 family) n=1 Tax=Evansella vedderi TaxID=38282 RepID=A0ABU0A063_9BACI|nr:TIGR01777 family oxidoreductase [Evansella vedderi]MDQ0256879.1 uncharacterized protein (TIGR01777 family) [Evansella vedderi]
MKVAIAGGSGFIGRAITKKLVEEGNDVYILTRNASNREKETGVTYVEWLREGAKPEEKLEDVDAFVNLAGENLNSGRWTSSKKEIILQSRVEATKEVVRIIHSMNKKPEVLINGSAIGVYGTSTNEFFSESSTSMGNDFLGNVVKKWEEEASGAKDQVRVVFARFGMVLDSNEGALKKMLLPFRLFMGGNLGSGKQWMSWIHINDVVRAILFCIKNKDMEGPVNMTAPNPVRMQEFGKTLASALHRPYWAPVPGFLLKIVLGEMSILVVEGQHVVPKVLMDNGFTFQFLELQPALDNLLEK